MKINRRNTQYLWLALALGCGDSSMTEDTDEGQTTSEPTQGSDTGASTGSSSTQSTGSEAGETGTEGDSASGTTDGSSSTGESEGSSTGGGCPVGQEGCKCGFNETCDGPNMCMDGKCTCPIGAPGCACTDGGTCGVEGNVCEAKTCVGCDAIDNVYCPLPTTCEATAVQPIKEYPDEPGFKWAFCVELCDVVNGVADPSNCQVPEGATGQAFCLQGPNENESYCMLSCNDGELCPVAGTCMNWGGGLNFCAYDNPLETSGQGAVSFTPMYLCSGEGESCWKPDTE